MLNKTNQDIRTAYHCIRQHRRYLTRQQCSTLVGQMKAGDVDGAMDGLSKILTRNGVASSKD